MNNLLIKDDLDNQIKNLQQTISNNFKYGLVIQGRTYTIPGKYDIEGFYRSLTPIEFLNYKIGICWDYVAYEDMIFKNLFKSVKYRLYYLESSDGRTHSFLVYWNKNNKPVLFEALFRACRGCFEFKDIKKLFDFMISKHFQYHSRKSYFILEYTQPDEYGLNAKEFMEYVTITGKLCMKDGVLYQNVK